MPITISLSGPYTIQSTGEDPISAFRAWVENNVSEGHGISHNDLIEEFETIWERQKTEMELDSYGLSELPPQICKCVFLEQLLLNENDLRTLPNEIAQLDSLVHLDLSDNEFESFPLSVCTMHKLEIISFLNNHLSQVPDAIFTLPNTCTIDLYGNPLTDEAKEAIRQKMSAADYNGPNIKNYQ